MVVVKDVKDVKDEEEDVEVEVEVEDEDEDEDEADRMLLRGCLVAYLALTMSASHSHWLRMISIILSLLHHHHRPSSTIMNL